jgi:hypothetical protein
MARTAVIAGTATAVSNRVSGSTAARAQAHQQQQLADQTARDEMSQLREQLAAVQAQQAMTAAQPAGGGDLIAKLQQLAQLKEAGMLSEEEFSAAKAKLLAG